MSIGIISRRALVALLVLSIPVALTGCEDDTKATPGDTDTTDNRDNDVTDNRDTDTAGDEEAELDRDTETDAEAEAEAEAETEAEAEIEADAEAEAEEEAAPATVKIRAVHASPDAPAVDVYVKEAALKIFTDIEYGETSAYFDATPGNYTLQIVPTGEAPNAATPEFAAQVPAGAKAITVVAAGLLGSTNDADKFRLIPLLENFDAPAAGSARVRIVHASADAPAVAIDVGNDGTPEVSDFARFAATPPAGVALPSGQKLQIGIWAGTPLARVTAFTTIELPDQAELFVIAVGRLGLAARDAKGFGLLAVAPTGSVGIIKQNPRVYALHASPDAPAVDVFAGAGELIDNLAFGQITTSGLQVPPGPYTLDFFAHAAGTTRPTGNPAASATTPALAAGERYLAVASGFLLRTSAPEAQKFQLIPLADQFAADAAKARLRALHASPDAPTVNVGAVGANDAFTSLFSGVSFPQASPAEGLPVDAATYTVGLQTTGANPAIAARFPGITLTAGQAYYAVAFGALTPAGAGEQGLRAGLVQIKADNTATIAVVQPAAR